MMRQCEQCGSDTDTPPLCPVCLEVESRTFVDIGDEIGWLMKRLQKKLGFALTPEEAKAAYDAAPDMPVSEERISEIVKFATGQAVGGVVARYKRELRGFVNNTITDEGE